MNRHAPKQATKAELRTRALLFLHQHPDPSKVTPQQLVGYGVSLAVAEELVAGVGR